MENIKRNADIESFLLGGQFEIEESWAFEQLAEYLNDLQLLRAGMKYEDLGIASRRHSARPALVFVSEDGRSIVSQNDNLRDHATTPAGSFAHLRLQGVMRSSDGASSRGIDSLVNDFHAANANPNIEGILLEVNSGGGESLAGTKLQSVISGSPKPMVAWVHLMASAALRGTLPADEIIGSSEASQVGSIGTYITLSKDFSRVYNAYYDDVYADKSTQKNTDFREYLKGNLEPLRKAINKSNDFFVNEVQSFRQLKGNIEDTLSGPMFHAKEAKQRGLIDSVGNFNYAVNRLQAAVKRRKMAH